MDLINTTTTPAPVQSVIKKNKGGRPKGKKNNQGLSLEKRIKVLQRIILDSNQKTCDRLQAIKTMTDLLADKVRVTESGSETTIIKFEENITKPLINVKNTEQKQPDITPVIVITPSNTTTTMTTTTTQPVKQEDVIEFKFTVDKNEQYKDI